jgi:hypothetical protein
VSRAWWAAYFSMIVAFLLFGLVVSGFNGAVLTSMAFVIGTTFGAVATNTKGKQ